MRGYRIERKKCCCGCNLNTGVACLATYQFANASLWMLQVALIVMEMDADGTFPLEFYFAIVNIVFTLLTSACIFVAICKKSEILLRLSSSLELLLIVSIHASVVVFFFSGLWITSFVAIPHIFLYFYFFTVIKSRAEELVQNRKVLELKSASTMRF